MGHLSDATPCHASRGAVRIVGPETMPLPPMFENRDRPAWLNWVILAIFLFSSWQLAGFWFERLHG